MNFSAFQLWREQCLRTNPGALDCAETNLYRTLASLQPKPNTSNSNHTIHRCDVARQWLARYGFPESQSRLALVCQGIRHALNLIFKELARTNASLWIPADVYPVYLELALAAGIKPGTFPTLPRPQFPQLENPGHPEYLLLANPLKPLGRFLSDQECDLLADWLEGSPHRYLLIDSVYDFSAPFHDTTRKLLLTGKAVLLHSVTKGWLWPRTFGIALLPKPYPQLESDFRNDPPPQKQLSLAEKFFSDEANLPKKVVTALDSCKNDLMRKLPAAVSKSLLNNCSVQTPGCYFFPTDIQADELLQRHEVIGIPASVFGAEWDGSILSSLSAPLSNSE